MSRKAEFLATIKPILDKKDIKQDTIKLATELTDVLNKINVGTNAGDLEELKKEFNAQLVEMGKQSIVFSENTLKGIVSQFANAVSEGIQVGVQDGSKAIDSILMSKLDELNKKREKIQKQIESIRLKYEKYEHYSEMNAMDMDEDIKPIKIDGDIDEQALTIMGNFTKAEDKLLSLKKGAKGYEEALIDATDAAEKLFQMRLTLEKNKTLVKDASILEDFDLGNLEDVVYDVFNKAESYFTNTLREWDWHGEQKELITQLEQIDNEINNIKKNNKDIFNVEQAKKYIKSLEEVESAYNRISTQKGTIKKTPKQNLQIALNPEQEVLTLTQLKTRYQNAVSSGDSWENTYSLIARFFNKFESDLQAGNISQDRLPEYQKLYDELTPVINNVRDALKSLIEFKQKSGSGVKETPSNTSPIVGTNDAKRKSEANKDAADSYSKAADEAEREKKANKESAEATERKAESTDAEIKKQERILQLVKAIVDVEKSNPNKEVGTFYNSQTGEFQKIGVGDEHRYHRSINDYVEASKQYDIGVHSHNTKFAAPSVTGKESDFNNWIKMFDLIKQQIIKAREELVLFNFSLLNEDQLKEVASKYREAAEKVLKEFDFNKIKGFESAEAADDALSARLKQELQTILNTYDGVMKTIQLPENLIYSQQTTGNNKHKAPSFADEYTKASEEVKGLIEDLAILQQKMKSLDYDDNNPEFNKIADQFDETLDKLPKDIQESFFDYGNSKWVEFSKQIAEEAAARRQNADAAQIEEMAINNVADAKKKEKEQDDIPDAESTSNQKKIESYEELCEVVKRYNELVLKKKTEGQTFTDADREELNSISGRIQVTRDPIASDDIVNEINAFDATLNALGTTTPEKLAHYLGIEIPEAARVATNAVDDLNSELNKEQKLKSQTEGSSTIIGTGNVSSEELKTLQDKNEQLRKEKENTEKDKSNAVERANNAEVEAEKLRNKLAGKDSEKSTAKATSIDKNELESILSRVTYNVRLEGDSQLDNSAEVLERVTSALSNIQINANADANAPWARESTLNGVIKNLLESIKSNTTGIGSTSKKAPTKETDYKKTSKDDYAGSPYFSEKLKTQVSKIEEYRAKLATSGRLTKEMDEQIDELLNKLKAVQNGPDFSVWSEEFKKLRTDENTSKIFDDFIGKENKNLYQQLIDLKKQEYEWGIKLLRAQQGSSEENNARQELELIQEKIRNHSVIYEDTEQELKLQKMQEEHLRNINELTSKQVDADNKQRLKEEAATVKELVELYQQLGQAKAMADAESDTVVKQPFVDRANQIQGEIDTKESTIDRSKYSQQFSGVQEESYRKQIVEELIDLYTKLGDTEAKEDRMSSGDATAKQYQDEANALQARIDATQQLIDVNKELQTQFDAARKSSVDKVVLKADRSDAVSGDKKFEKLAKLYEKLGKLQAQADATGNAVKQEDARQLDEAIKKEREQLVLSEAQTEELQRRLKISKQNEALRQGSVEAQNKFEKQIKDSRNKARLNSINSINRNAQDALNEAAMIEGLSPESIDRMKLLSAEMDKLQKKYAEIEAKGGVVSDKDQKDVVAQIGNVKRLSSDVSDLVAEYARLSGDNAKEIGTFDGPLSGASLDEYKRQLTEAVMTATNGKAQIKGFDNATKTLSYTVKTGSNEFTNYTAAVRGSDNALVSLQGETKRTETFMESITRKTKEISTYLISSISLYDIINRFKQGVQYVKEIDGALTELKKVTDETEDSYDRFLQTASKTAAKVGSTIKDIVSSTADWARLGYSMEEASDLAESTAILMNVSEFDSVDSSTSALISTLQAFNIATSESMTIVDKFNQVGNEFAVSSSGIATALQNSASALMTANNDLDQSIALVAAANRVVQDESEVGSALRTISLRLRGTKVSVLQEMGEDADGAVESVSKLQAQLKALTEVNILTDSGAYKSTYEILLEISRVWDSLTDSNRAATLELIAGKNRSNVAAAILENTKDLEEAYESSINSAGK